MNWTCDRCIEQLEGLAVGDLRRAGAYVEPYDPDVECASCGARPSEAVRTRLLLSAIRDGLPGAGLVVGLPRPADTTAPNRRNTTAGILSARAAAARLGVNRSTLGRLVQAEILATVPKGGRRGYRTADVEALIDRGFTLDVPAQGPPPKKTTRRRSRKNGVADPSVEARLAKF